MTLEQYLSWKNLRPTAFAAELGVPSSTITRILRGERSPGLRLMVQISEKTAGAVTPNDFVTSVKTETAA
jgi:plasmid maintenance system antidote protein VapI